MRVTLERAVAVFRAAMLLLASGLVAHTWDRYAHPGRAVVVLVVMAGWSVVASLPLRREALVVLRIADVVAAVGAVLATRLVDTATRIDSGAATLPLAWAAAPVLAAGIDGGPWAGMAAGLTIGVADVVERGTPTATNANSLVLLVVAGGVTGWLGRLLARARRAEARAAAEQERARLAADIHDSVLQVLALVARGTGELASFAGEQEQRLRTLVSSGPVDVSGPADLRALVVALARPGVEVAAPAGAVLVESAVAQALSAACSAALDNVAQHAGAGARAWVLLEDEGDCVRLTVRDDGVGFDPARLRAASEEGRLGVSTSIRRRVAGVGGTVTVTSQAGSGTEVELVVRR